MMNSVFTPKTQRQLSGEITTHFGNRDAKSSVHILQHATSLNRDKLSSLSRSKSMPELSTVQWKSPHTKTLTVKTTPDLDMILTNQLNCKDLY